ncbi:MAG: sugar transferase [Propionibacteriaceae bacterium]|nr:sugar transferase [Propionibacteriaceae bacterium]
MSEHPDESEILASVTSAIDVPERSWVVKGEIGLTLLDIFVVTATVFTTFAFRPGLNAELSGAPNLSYWEIGLILDVLWVVVLGLYGSRSPRILGSGIEEYQKLIVASFWVFAFAAIFSYCFRVELSRMMFLTTLPIGIVTLLLGRWVARKYLVKLRSIGRATTPTLIIGDAAEVAELVHDLNHWTVSGFRPRAICVTSGAAAEYPDLEGLQSITEELVIPLVGTGKIGALILTRSFDREQARRLSWQLEDSPVLLIFQPEMLDVAGPRTRVRAIEGMSLVHVDLPRYSGYKFAVKRLFDIVFSSAALIITSPLLLVVAILIKVEDGGPVIFRQERIGRLGKPFTVHKFRTMCVDAEAKVGELIKENGGHALLFKLEDDPRVTRIGKFLRKYSIDEIPQFWTVLKGAMSVVGPRPQVAREVAEYSDFHYRRLLMKPGITGLWQVNGRSDLSPEDAIRLDMSYVENWTLTGDLVIILKTVAVVLKGEGAA